MNKSGPLFLAVIQQVKETDAAQLSVEHASLRDAIVRCKVSQLQSTVTTPPPEVTLLPLGYTLLPTESPTRRHIESCMPFRQDNHGGAVAGICSQMVCHQQKWYDRTFLGEHSGLKVLW